jgi:formylglycine-generating enzyme required for sulfatase activity
LGKIKTQTGLFAMELKFQTHPVDGAKMVFVPAGTFLMGRPAADILAKPHEVPQRTVFLSAYWIDVYPVTNARYRRFLDEGGYEFQDYWDEEGWDWKRENGVTAPTAWNRPGWNEPNQPAAGVSWHEASAYARWAHKKLPTEAQWERAARGTDGRDYPWGNEWPRRDLANFNDHVGHVTPVGAYPKGVSPCGCHDMAGNVNNWCEDWYWPEFYAYAAAHGLDNDPVLNDGLVRQLGIDVRQKCDRGGGYATSIQYMEILGCTDKVSWDREARALWNGFRTVSQPDLVV